MADDDLVGASPAERHRRVAGDFTARVRATTDWDAPAPVAGWTARDVVGHLVEWFPGFLASGSGIRLPDGPAVAEDPVGAWVAHAEGVQAVLDAEDVADREFSHRHTGTMPVPVAVDRFYTADVFMHTWDLATATGQPAGLDPAFCAELLAGMQELEQVIRESGQYGAAVPVPADADVQTRLLGFIGRDPRWTPSG